MDLKLIFFFVFALCIYLVKSRIPRKKPNNRNVQLSVNLGGGRNDDITVDYDYDHPKRSNRPRRTRWRTENLREDYPTIGGGGYSWSSTSLKEPPPPPNVDNVAGLTGPGTGRSRSDQPTTSHTVEDSLVPIEGITVEGGEEDLVETEGTDDKKENKKKKFYLGVEEAVNWFEGMSRCKQHYRDYAMIKNQEEMDNLAETVNNQGFMDRRFWLGANDLARQGYFTWTDTQPLEYAPWNEAQPDNYGNNEHCLETVPRRGFKWNDADCKALKYYVCEYY